MLNPAITLVTEICRAGAVLETGRDGLRVTAPAGVLTDEIKIDLIVHKQAIVQLAEGAVALLNSRGVRLLGWRLKPGVAMWRDADGPEVRAALACVGLADVEVHYLDDANAWVADRHRQYIPQYVRDLWEQRGLEITPQIRVWADLKARRINEFFDEYGTSEHPSRVKAQTVIHGWLSRDKSGRP